MLDNEIAELIEEKTNDSVCGLSDDSDDLYLYLLKNQDYLMILVQVLCFMNWTLILLVVMRTPVS